MQSIQSLAALLALALPLSAQSPATPTERSSVPGELVVSFRTPDSSFDLASRVEAWGLEGLAPGQRIDGVRPLLQWVRRGEVQTTNVVLLEFSPASLDHDLLVQRLQQLPEVRWATPNTAIQEDPRELIPNDPLYGSQYHHGRMQNDLAWDITLGDASVIMGITDDGVDTNHADLAPSIWVNGGEIPGNGQDDDGNGYVDDVNGWDFQGNNNNPNPSNGNDHGTHCAGIAGARTDNGVGIAGTAGRATIMPLQFYVSGQSWTAAMIAETFAYGADNGARIISTSYNMDGWVGDATVHAAFDYIYDAGVLHFNSAGNGGSANPPRQVFHQTFLVASTNSADVKSGFSNWGTGIDLAAPGDGVFSTILNNNYGTKSGTSMAAPNAAGAAALIWSANPSWTRDQVAAQLYATADDIDAQNPSIAGLLGGGRANSFRALTTNLPGSRVSSVEGLPAEGTSLVGELGTIELRFDQILDPATVNQVGAFTLTYAGSDTLFGTADDVSVGLDTEEYLICSNRVKLTVLGSLPGSGNYRFEAKSEVLANPFGTAIDGDEDGAPGGSWVRTFAACAVVPVLVDNAESGADWSVVNQSLSTGAWTVPPVVPNGGGLRNDPPTDYDGSGRCFVTQNGSGDTDVDGGPTRLVSRAIDTTVVADPFLSFARWLVTSGDDTMVVDISTDDGASWTQIDVLEGTDGWEVETYRVLDFVAQSPATRLRFSVADLGTASITEAGIDYLRLLEVVCETPIGDNYCIGAPNSTGSGSTMSASGSTVVADNNFILSASNVPQNQPGIFFFGPQQGQISFGDGFRCVGGFLVRLKPTVTPDSSGDVFLPVDLSLPPQAGQLVPGATMNFQFWYRDPAALLFGFNLSDGLTVTFQ